MLGNRTGFLSETALMQSRKWLSSSYIMFSRVAGFLGTTVYSQVPFSLLDIFAGKKIAGKELVLRL